MVWQAVGNIFVNKKAAEVTTDTSGSDRVVMTHDPFLMTCKTMLQGAESSETTTGFMPFDYILVFTVLAFCLLYGP